MEKKKILFGDFQLLVTVNMKVLFFYNIVYQASRSPIIQSYLPYDSFSCSNILDLRGQVFLSAVSISNSKILIQFLINLEIIKI